MLVYQRVSNPLSHGFSNGFNGFNMFQPSQIGAAQNNGAAYAQLTPSVMGPILLGQESAGHVTPCCLHLEVQWNVSSAHEEKTIHGGWKTIDIPMVNAY